MRGIITLIAAFSMLLAASGFSGDAVLNVDFSKVGEVLHVKAKGSFDGPLPAGCAEDFSPMRASVVNTERLVEGDRGFLRFNTQKLDSLVVFRVSDTNIEPGYYKIDVVCRCPDAPLSIRICKHVNWYDYTPFCEEDIKKGSGWVERAFFVYLEIRKPLFSNVVPDASKIWLYIFLEPGITDIASLKLSKISKDDYVAGKSAGIRRPEKGLANLFRNSRFPLGMQSGWSIDRANNVGKVEADPASIGPSGAPSLKINSKTRITVYSEPFQSDNPLVKNWVSFAFKGEGNWDVSIVKGGVSKKNLVVTQDWKTEKIEFNPDQLSKGFSLAFSGSGTLNLDSFMAKSGNAEDSCVSAGDCEIALAPTDSELAGTRIQFSDEPATVKFCATGAIDGAILKAKVVNVYGEERVLSDVKLGRSLIKKLCGFPAPWMESGSLDFNVFPEANLGVFRVEAWAERDGKRISPFNEIVMTRIRRPVYWGKDAPNSPFGGHFYWNARVVSTMKAAGMNWARLNDLGIECTAWGWLEAEKGKWQFQDETVASYRNANIKILSLLGTAPTWASYFSGVKSPHYFDMTYQPKDIEAFKNYVRTVTKHYEGVIDEYQFQNEPWGSVFWHKSYDPATGKFDQGETPAQDYADLSKVAYEEFKKSYPSAVFYGFNTSGMPWTKAVFDAGAYPYCDMIDYHLYTQSLCGFPDDIVAQSYNWALGYIKDHVPAPMKPVVMSEGNANSDGVASSNIEDKDDFAGFYNHTIPWKSANDYTEAADMNCRFVVSHLALGVKRVFLYSDHCYEKLLTPPYFPVLLGADGYPHPSLAAFSHMAWLLEDRKFVKCVPVGEKVWAYLFEGRGATVAVISGEKNGRFTFKPVEGLELTDLFGNRVIGKSDYRGNLLYVTSSLPSSKLERILSDKP